MRPNSFVQLTWHTYSIFTVDIIETIEMVPHCKLLFAVTNTVKVTLSSDVIIRISDV